jgi:hypothetical protein
MSNRLFNNEKICGNGGLYFYRKEDVKPKSIAYKICEWFVYVKTHK